MPTNDFKPFAAAATANVISQSAYLALPALLTGFQSGTAWSPQLNKVWRQASLIASMIGQFSVDNTGQDFIDDGTIDPLEATFIAALQQVIRDTTGRRLLTADLDLYVSTAGDDNNAGTSASPYRSIQKAWNVAKASFDVAGHNIKIHLAAGTYASFVAAGQPIGASSVSIVGDVNNPGNYVISGASGSIAAVAATNSSVVVLEGVKLTSTSAGAYATSSGLIWLKKVEFGACSTYHIAADNAGRVEVQQIDSYTSRYPYLITGAAQVHLYAAAGGFVQVPYSNVTISGSPTFSAEFALSGPLGRIDASGSIYGGSATGKRYFADSLGYIETSGGGSSFFPGNTAGTLGTYGVYR